MKNLIFNSLFILTACSCSSDTNQQKKPEHKTIEVEQATDTLDEINVVKRSIKELNKGKRATEYFVVQNLDSSEFIPVFRENVGNGKIRLNLVLNQSNPTKTFNQLMNELKMIMPVAALDYDMDSLESISMGRLIQTGDLAIKITKEYKEKFGSIEEINQADYKKISAFLKGESSLSKNLNNLLSAYDKSVNRVGIEKVFFMDKEELLKHSKITTDTTLIPERILDFMIWIDL